MSASSPGNTRAAALPVGGQRRAGSGIWGMWMLIGTEAALFSYLLFSYFYIAAQHTGAWPPSGPPALTKASVNTVVLLASSLCAWLAERGARKSDRASTVSWLAVALLLGVAFTTLQLSE